MSFRLLLVALALALTSLPKQVSAEAFANFKIGLWTGSAFRDDKTKAFTHCGAWVPFKSGISLFVVVDKNFQWRLAFSNNGWRMTPGRQIPVSLMFDGRGPVRVTAIAQNPTFAIVEMPTNSALVRAFRAAHFMDAFADGEKFSFKLDGTARLLPELVQCVNRGTQPAVASAPRPRTEPPARTATTNTESEQERTKLLTEAAAEHRKCMTQQMRTIVPYSDERAEVLAQVVVTNCNELEEKFVRLGVALLNLPRANVVKAVEDALNRQKKSMVAEIVTFRAELAKALIAEQEKERQRQPPAQVGNGI